MEQSVTKVSGVTRHASCASQNRSGFAIIEVLISMVVALFLISIFGSLTVYATKMNRMNRGQLQGTLYLREMAEVIKDLEQSADWAEIQCSAECHPVISGNIWLLQNGRETLEGKYERYLTIQDENPDKKKVSAYINWDNGFFDQNLSLESYIYDD